MLIQNPPISGEGEHYVHWYRNPRFDIRKYPTYLSDSICLMTGEASDPDLTVEGIHKGKWIKLKTSDGIVGYVNTSDLGCVPFSKAKTLTLHPRKRLTLLVGKQHELIPLFSPKNSAEQVTYTVEDPSVAIVNKAGYVLGLSTGRTLLTAISETGLMAKCQIEVVTTLHKSGMVRKIASKVCPDSVKKALKKAKKLLNS